MYCFDGGQELLTHASVYSVVHDFDKFSPTSADFISFRMPINYLGYEHLRLRHAVDLRDAKLCNQNMLLHCMPMCRTVELVCPLIYQGKTLYIHEIDES